MSSNLLVANSDVLILLARLLLMSLFLVTGWQKLTNFSGTVTYMSSIGAPAPTLSTIISIIMEFFVGIALIIGVFTRQLALLYVVFVLATALVGHRYWTLEGAARHENQINFFKNMSIMGGLLLLAITGPGRFAIMP
ncbi:DoxX family protein [Paralcaligenes ureilyticus]|uniref:Putative oxidoreductase n=1 Tax=Paralcaligenes ureilyticus TaxID=627131 RepID=A0A4R3M631_9BURK|nr:DoxX family protein [Paralcaligenes ureilyticus]TCT08851.1 putative oxidoreductase [Paralcaligenes ureilyticus]